MAILYDDPMVQNAVYVLMELPSSELELNCFVNGSVSELEWNC